ncbi:hypothetical protein GYMLUDRAFT_154027 [Collybiopsis luxurians FD-317 M1]|nr:hypothetical protein GYMLUDRAFT_154027 [Collybiopsis luxurians FD-317 M1]
MLLSAAMDNLPIEILSDILQLSLETSSPTNILCTCSYFHSVAQIILHQNLKFHSSSQLLRFAHVVSEKTTSLACEPQSIALDFAGGASFGIFEGLHAVLTALVSDVRCKIDENGRLVLETMRLRLNSLNHDDHRLIYTSLSRANVVNFFWTGPDPSTNFSIAIVAPAVFPLFTALASHTHLTHLHLTNIAFPDPIVTPDPRWTGIPCLPSVRVLYLGQVTFLTAEHVAEFLLRCTRHGLGKLGDSTSPATSTTSTSSLESLRLVDAYEESIWGPRLKLPRILAAAGTSLLVHQSNGELLAQHDLDSIAKLVSVDAKTERIMGGDRAIPELAFTLATASTIR